MSKEIIYISKNQLIQIFIVGMVLGGLIVTIILD
jgi:hypothetical protein